MRTWKLILTAVIVVSVLVARDPDTGRHVVPARAIVRSFSEGLWEGFARGLTNQTDEHARREQASIERNDARWIKEAGMSDDGK